ncbi:MAG: DUF1587 domain-containing protein, partial [Gammaproteobacteria bacterium]
MNSRLLGAAALGGILLSGCGMIGNEVEQHSDVVADNCFGCHNAIDLSGDLNLESLSLAQVSPDSETWEKVIAKLRAGLMPPGDGPRLDTDDRAELVAYLEREIDAHAELHLPAPGLHRLNRTEYSNAIRDLLALNVDATGFLPPDDS